MATQEVQIINHLAEQVKAGNESLVLSLWNSVQPELYQLCKYHYKRYRKEFKMCAMDLEDLQQTAYICFTRAIISHDESKDFLEECKSKILETVYESIAAFITEPKCYKLYIDDPIVAENILWRVMEEQMEELFEKTDDKLACLALRERIKNDIQKNDFIPVFRDILFEVYLNGNEPEVVSHKYNVTESTMKEMIQALHRFIQGDPEFKKYFEYC